MQLNPFQLLEIVIAITAIMMLGATSVRFSLVIYGLQALLLSIAAAWHGLGCFGQKDYTLVAAALMMILVKAIFAPLFLGWIVTRIRVQEESTTFIPAPICMHMGIGLLAVSYILASKLHAAVLPNLRNDLNLISANDGGMGATASLAILFMGMLLILSRKLAISQIIGFLVLENGIFLYSLTQTRDMPLIVEMGFLLDLLVLVMIAGLMLFRIKRSFEHVDVSQLTHLRD